MNAWNVTECLGHTDPTPAWRWPRLTATPEVLPTIDIISRRVNTTYQASAQSYVPSVVYCVFQGSRCIPLAGWTLYVCMSLRCSSRSGMNGMEHLKGPGRCHCVLTGWRFGLNYSQGIEWIIWNGKKKNNMTKHSYINVFKEAFDADLLYHLQM